MMSLSTTYFVEKFCAPRTAARLYKQFVETKAVESVPVTVSEFSMSGFVGRKMCAVTELRNDSLLKLLVRQHNGELSKTARLGVNRSIAFRERKHPRG